MKRLLILLITLPLIAQAPAQDKWVEAWNDFALSANEWGKLANSHLSGAINARELKLWNETKQKWGKAKKEIEQEY